LSDFLRMLQNPCNYIHIRVIIITMCFIKEHDHGLR
jgi:hypothetical protein